MSKLTVAPEMYTKGKTGNTLASIAIRVTYKGIRKYKPTDYRVPVDCWDGFNVLKGYSGYQKINAKLQTDISKITLDLIELKEQPGFSIATIEKYLNEGKKGSRISFTDTVVKYIKTQSELNKKAAGTIRNYEKELSKIRAFGGNDIYFDEIDAGFLERYELHLKEKGNSKNTLWNSCRKFPVKFFTLAKIPFPEDYEKPKYNDTTREYLTLDEIKKIEKVLPQMIGDERKVCVFFLVECFSGLRHSDWSRFSVEKLVTKEGLKVRAKKNGEPVYISLHNRPKLKKVLDVIKNEKIVMDLELHKCNAVLKNIGARAQLKKSLSTHIARHSYATLMSELGFSVEYISESMGITPKTASIYAKVTRQKLKAEDKIRKGL